MPTYSISILLPSKSRPCQAVPWEPKTSFAQCRQIQLNQLQFLYVDAGMRLFSVSALVLTSWTERIRWSTCCWYFRSGQVWAVSFTSLELLSRLNLDLHFAVLSKVINLLHVLKSPGDRMLTLRRVIPPIRWNSSINARSTRLTLPNRQHLRKGKRQQVSFELS